jgi:uncharacterized protein
MLTRLDDLASLLRDAPADAPVERWNPPYCGDIGLAIDGNGGWSYRGSAILRPALVKLFSRVLRRDADGRTYLVTPAEKVDISIADVPFMAVEMEVAGAGPAQSLTFRTNVDEVVACGRDHPLRFFQGGEAEGVRPYVHVRGRLEARLTRALTHDLFELVAENEDGRPGLWSRGAFFALG